MGLERDTIYIGAFIFVAIYTVATLAYFMFRQYLRFRERELATRVHLDDFRAHLERQLTELNRRFSESEGRWRELNHLVVAGQTDSRDLSRQRLPAESEFLRSHGIELRDTAVEDDLLFVLTPFHEDFSQEYEVIARTGRELDFKVSRGDEKVPTGEIFPHLLRLMVKARIIVANISGRNPNVFYELGVAHALDKTVILVAHSKADIPFDVQSKRIVFYKDNEELRRELERMLARVLKHRSA
jgi:hypothetical protein